MDRILVGFDGSEPAVRAARLAASIAAQLGTKLTLVDVVPVYSYPVDVSSLALARLTQDRERRARAEVDGLAAELRSPVLSVDAEVPLGQAGEELIRLAERPDVRMLVVGHKGRGAVSRMLLGSVATRVVHACSKPVLVVR